MGLTLGRLREEEGFSLITAILVSLVVLTLSSVTVGLSMQNNNQSGRSRERVNAVAAAEAGINYQFSKLQSGSIECTAAQTLGSFPSSNFETTLYSQAGAPLDPDGPGGTACTGIPADGRVLIRSVGKATGEDPVRTMEALVELTPTGGTFGDGALFAEGDIMIDSNPDIGAPAGDFNADVYSNGNIELKSNPEIVGSVISQKCVRMDSTAVVHKDVLARGGTPCTWGSDTVTMLSNTKVLRDVVANSGRIVFGSSARVSRDAKTVGNMSPWSCGSLHSCGPPGHATHVGGTALRNQPTSSLPAPLVRPYPTFAYNSADWTKAGVDYTEVTYSGSGACNSAKTLIGSNNTVKRVIRLIATTCELSWSLSSSSPIRLTADLAIVTDGSILLDSGTRFIAPEGGRTLHLIAGMGSGSPDYCFRMLSTTRIGNNPPAEPGISTLVYTKKNPTADKCKVFLDSNADIRKGQVFGGNKIDVKSNTQFSYTPVVTPGAPTSGYKESILYVRETSSTSS